ncbi:MAG: hypothetical protein CVT92_05965 [Bacteroidetes bacterium HGW-Bacteroidetes-1]|nr:MAG: hypothetical protein CVT92_05965 [Bacteroidetes bacterium HGW-Bacteroidetes-1]
MLFGEYSVLLGSKALVVPFERYSAQWSYAEKDDNSLNVSDYKARNNLKAYISHLLTVKNTNELLSFEDLEQELEKGLFFRSHIPQGYGAGSSGALVAALYDNFSSIKVDHDLQLLQQQLASLESFFHGNSSGLDPLACYLRAPILVDEFKQIHSAQLNLNNQNIYLIDSNLTAETGPLVAYFRQQMHSYSFFKKVNGTLIPSVNNAVESLLSGDRSGFFTALEKISQFQFDHLKPMIPENLSKQWISGLESKEYFMKLCGSGGGGYILLFSKNSTAVLQHFKMDEIVPLQNS